MQGLSTVQGVGALTSYIVQGSTILAFCVCLEFLVKIGGGERGVLPPWPALGILNNVFKVYYFCFPITKYTL